MRLVDPRERRFPETRVAGVERTFRQTRCLAVEAAQGFEVFDQRGVQGGASADNLLGAREGLEKARHFFVQEGFHTSGIDALAYVDLHHEAARELVQLDVGAHVRGDLLFVDETLKQTTRLAASEDLGGDPEQMGVALHPGGHNPASVDARVGHAVRHHLAHALPCRTFWDPAFECVQRRSRRNVAEVLLHQRLGGGRVDVAGERDHRVVRTVVALEPRLHVVKGRGVQILHRADGGPAVGVPFRKHAFEHSILDGSKRLIVALTFFVLNDPPLIIELLLRDRTEKVPHAIALQPEGELEGGRGDGLKVVGAIKPGGPVDRGRAELVEGLEELAVEVLAAVEHQMLGEMSEAGFAPDLVLRAHVVPEGDRDHRRLAVRVDDDAQAVVQGRGGIQGRNRRIFCGDRVRLLGSDRRVRARRHQEGFDE